MCAADLLEEAKRPSLLLEMGERGRFLARLSPWESNFTAASCQHGPRRHHAAKHSGAGSVHGAAGFSDAMVELRIRP